MMRWRKYSFQIEITRWKSVAVQEGEDVFRGDLILGTITELTDESIDDGLVGSDRIFLEWVLW